MAIINKKLIHFKTKSQFNQCYLSINPDNTQFNNGLESVETIPEDALGIKYLSIVFIRDTQEIWTHGLFYKCAPEDLSKIQSAIDELNSNVDRIEMQQTEQQVTGRVAKNLIYSGLGDISVEGFGELMGLDALYEGIIEEMGYNSIVEAIQDLKSNLGSSIQIITLDEYDSLLPNPNTLYIVD